MISDSLDEGTGIVISTLTSEVESVCGGGDQSCNRKLGRLVRRLFDLVQALSDTDDTDDEGDDDGDDSLITDYIQGNIDLICLRAGPGSYCVPQVAQLGLFDQVEQDDPFVQGDDDTPSGGPTPQEMATRCSPCGKAVQSLGGSMLNSGPQTKKVVSYGCGMGQGTLCAGVMSEQSAALLTACASPEQYPDQPLWQRRPDLFDFSENATCSSNCSMAIKAAMQSSACCAEGVLYETTVRATNNAIRWYNDFDPTASAIRSRILDACSNLQATDFPTTCEAVTAGETKIRLTNVKSTFIKANEASLKASVCTDVTRQVGARMEQCTVTEVVTSGTTATFTVSLRLETDAATVGATILLQNMAQDGTLDLEDSVDYLDDNKDEALDDPTKPAGGTGSSGAGGDDFPAPFDDDGNPSGAVQVAVAAALAASVGVAALH